MDLETIIFDWSGVISNDIAPVYKVCMKIHEFFDIQGLSFDEWKNKSRNPHSLYWQSFLPDVNMKTIQYLFEEFFERETPQLLPGVKDTLEFLKARNIDMYVLSAHPQQFVCREAEEYGINEYFNEIIGGKFYKDRKLIEIIKDNNLDKGNTLFAEDMVEGLIAGRAAGVKTAGILTGYHSEEKFRSLPSYLLPDFIFKDINGLKTLFS